MSPRGALWSVSLCLLFFAAVPARLAAAEVSLTGVWTGRFEYPDDANKPPVEITAVLVQEGEAILGVMREPNTFGTTDAPSLHASLHGTYLQTNPAGGALVLHKSYDGTSGAAHGVGYLATYHEATDSILGLWSIPGDWCGQVLLTRQPQTGPGPLAGVWAGEYQYPEQVQQPPVPFVAVLVHHAGDELRGWMREPNSFGNPVEPFLQAEIVGAWDSRGQSLQFMKTYDGVGGQSHNVLYVGRIGKDRRVAGKWEIPEVWGASFAMLPLRAERARQLLEHRPEAVTPLIPPATPRKDLFFRGGLPPATR